MDEMLPRSLTPAPDSLTAKLAPEVVAALAAEQAAILALIPNMVERWALAHAWPHLLLVAPKIVATVVTVARRRYGSLTLGELADRLAART